MTQHLEKKPIHDSPDVLDDAIEVRRARRDCGVPLHRVHRGIALFAVIALLLNADAIQRGAALMPYGRTRDAALALSTPLARAARALRLHVPRRWVERAVHGREER